MGDTAVLDRPMTLDSDGTGLGGTAQVVLWNDSVNSFEYVWDCLMRVFGHSSALAWKIMLEAHEKGKAIAEVEGAEEANGHCHELVSLGLRATVELI